LSRAKMRARLEEGQVQPFVRYRLTSGTMPASPIFIDGGNDGKNGVPE